MIWQDKWQRILAIGVMLLCSAIISATGAVAQVNSGTIVGTVTDQTGAILPRAKITVRSVETGIARTTNTDETGRYQVPQLGPGNYEVQVELSGFGTAIRKGISLSVGREAVVDAHLQVGEVSQSVEVVGEAPLIQTGTSEIGGLVNDKQIRDLPLNGRDFTQLIFLQPGVIQQRYALQSPNTGSGSRISAGGARMNYNNFLIDGTRKNEFGGTTTGSVAGVQLGVDAIQEFRVLTHNFSAEFGQNAGAIITAVTRSGTNDLHGSVFYFHRNDNFDARNFFDEGAPPEFKRNQFGGSVGGPIVKERTFYFGAYEGFRERRGTTNTSYTPTVAARNGLLNDPATGTRVQVDPRVKPFLDLYPLPNGEDLGDGSGVYTYAYSAPTNEDFLTARVDHHFSDNDFLFARYQFSDADRGETRSAGIFADITTSRQQMITLQETHMFSPNVINTGNVGFNRASPRLNSREQIPIDASLATAPGLKIARITISGIEGGAAGSAGGAITEIGPRNLDGGLWVTNSYQVRDDLNYIHGEHSLKSGVYVERQHYNVFQGDFNGAMQFASLARFLQARPTRFTVEDPNSPRAWRQTTFGLYLQDDWKAMRNLTLNLGLRWEFATPHKDTFGRNAVITNTLAPTISVLDSMYKVGMKNLAPRFGFAWDISGNGKTSLRGGAGVFHNLLVGRAESIGLTRNPPYGGTFQASNPPFPSSVALPLVGVSGLPRPSGWSEHLKVPTVYHYNLNLERQIWGGTVVRAGYTGSGGRHLVGKSSGNTAYPQILADGSKFFPAGLPVRNPRMGDILWYFTDANSFYNAFELSIIRRSARGVQMQISYTHAKALDDQSSLAGADNQQDGGFLLDPDVRNSDRGRSIIDARHNLSANFGYELPVGPGKALDVKGVAGKIAGGWQVNSILSASSGVPFTAAVGFNQSRNRDTRAPDRPNLLPGRSNNPTVGKSTLWFDPTAFALPPAGTFGNLARNTVEGPGVAVLDFSLVKNTGISEKVRTEFKAEFFNILNHSNLGLPQSLLFDPSGKLIGNVGRISNTSTTSREIQFGLKLVF